MSEREALIGEVAARADYADPSRVLGERGAAAGPGERGSRAPRQFGYGLKRLLDYALGIPIAVLSVPVLLLAGLCIRLVDGGPVFYRQARVGRYGKEVRIWKLRSMYVDAEDRLARYLQSNEAVRQEWERCFKLKDDPRVLPGVGEFLRSTSLDELPQIINVLCGEMSLVGPRPFPRYHMDRFDQPFQDLRTSVLPGITGLWQISSRGDGDLEAQKALDGYYVLNRGLWLDLYILLRTVGVVLSRKGAY